MPRKRPPIEQLAERLGWQGDDAVRAEESPPELRPSEVAWREQAPQGKLDLLTTLDFWMTSNALFSDVVLPAATWYERSTSPALTCTRSSTPSTRRCRRPGSRSPTGTPSGGPPSASPSWPRNIGVRRDLIAAPLLHDSAEEIA